MAMAGLPRSANRRSDCIDGLRLIRPPVVARKPAGSDNEGSDLNGTLSTGMTSRCAPGKTHIGTHDEDRRTRQRMLIRLVLPPSEELRNAVDLIIVPAIGKRQQLGEELAEPRRAVRQADVAGLDLGRLGRHAIDFAAFRLDA